MKEKITMIIVVTMITINLMPAQTLNFGTIDYNTAINISGKQRMLSQKMSKVYLLMSNGVNNESIKKELNSSKFIFEKQLDILNKNAVSRSTKINIKDVYSIWKDFKAIITEEATKEGALKIMEINTKLLDACHQLVLRIEANSKYGNEFYDNNNQELIKTINISGKQRMLSQRMCLYFTATKIFPENKTQYKAVLEKAFDEFSDVIGVLLINTYNTTDIEEELGFIMGLWETYQDNKKKFLNADFESKDVYYVTNNLTKSFNTVTGLYERVAKGLKR